MEPEEQPVDIEDLMADIDHSRVTDLIVGGCSRPPLDTSSPTLLHHLRRAQKRVVDDILGSNDD